MCNNRGRFVNGNPGKPLGSSKNQLREHIRDFLSENWVNLPKWFRTLTAREKIDVMTQLLPYALPRLKQAELIVDADISEKDDQAARALAIERGFDRLFSQNEAKT